MEGGTHGNEGPLADNMPFACTTSLIDLLQM
ncbi:hypothetical protein ACVI3U_004651 [Sinorhizobium medicae]